MNLLKLKQFALVLCCLISLFVPTIAAACTCPQETETSDHCHSEHSSLADLPETLTSANHHHDEETALADSSETDQTVISEADCCSCTSSILRAVAKSPNIKIEKQFLLVALQPLKVEFKTRLQVASVKTIVFANPFYLSDSFYNISPGRAPPRL